MTFRSTWSPSRHLVLKKNTCQYALNKFRALVVPFCGIMSHRQEIYASGLHICICSDNKQHSIECGASIWNNKEQEHTAFVRSVFIRVFKQCCDVKHHLPLFRCKWRHTFSIFPVRQEFSKTVYSADLQLCLCVNGGTNTEKCHRSCKHLAWNVSWRKTEVNW